MEKIYTGIAALGAAIAILHCCDPAHAQQIGDACTANAGQLQTKQSAIPIEGSIGCLPDSNGNYYWQPTSSGMVRYDTTSTCSVGGMLRWNGSAIQFCNGVSWQSLGGGEVGKLYWGGSWTSDFYFCDSGYSINEFHYDCGCSNNATWFDCEAN